MSKYTDSIVSLKNDLTPEQHKAYTESYKRFKEGKKTKQSDPEPMSDEYKAYLKKLKEPTITTPKREEVVQVIWSKLNKRAVNGNFEPTAAQRVLMNDLFAHFSHSNNNKGYCLIGGYGCGKTELMKAFVSTRFQPYDYLKSGRNCMITSAIEMIDYYNKDSNFDKYLETNIYIDDFGTEQRAKYMSKDEEPILSKFLELWYMKNRDKNLYITTNLSIDEIQSKYGGRVYSRLNELCQFIELSGKDFRV